jgi:germination protein M
METRNYIILGVLFVLFAVLVILFFQTGVEKKREAVPPDPSADAEIAAVEPAETKTIRLFFLAEEDDLLHGEEREIVSDSSLIFEAKQTVEELLKGSNNGFISPFPPETKLREIFLTQEGVVCVDLSKEVQDEHLSGATAEISTVYAIVNSLAYNFDPIKKVIILVDGSEMETLKGHVDISRPLVPMYNLISR